MAELVPLYPQKLQKTQRTGGTTDNPLEAGSSSKVISDGLLTGRRNGIHRVYWGNSVLFVEDLHFIEIG